MKRILVLLFSLIYIIFLCGCKKDNSKMPDYSEEMFVKLRFTPVDVKETELTYSMNVEIYQDTKVVIYADGFSKWYGEDEPEVFETNLNEEQINDIKIAISDNQLWDMHKDVGNKDNLQGIKKEITIYTVDGERTIYGINPSNRSFNYVYDLIYDLERENISVYVDEIDKIQSKGAKNDTGIVICNVNDETVFTYEDIEEIYIEIINDNDDNAEETDEETDEKTDEEELYRLVIRLTEDNVDKLKELSENSNDEGLVTFSLYNDKKLITVMFSEYMTDSGKMYSNNIYSKEEGEELINMLENE